MISWTAHAKLSKVISELLDNIKNLVGLNKQQGQWSQLKSAATELYERNLKSHKVGSNLLRAELQFLAATNFTYGNHKLSAYE